MGEKVKENFGNVISKRLVLVHTKNRNCIRQFDFLCIMVRVLERV